MLSINEALKLTSEKEAFDEIESRMSLGRQMAGTLCPSILMDEIGLLGALQWRIRTSKKKEPIQQTTTSAVRH